MLFDPQLSSLFANISEKEQQERINKVQELASSEGKVRYGCFSHGLFRKNLLRENQFYLKYVLPSDLSEKKILDIGCGLGTDLRRIILDGAKPSNVVGCDVDEGSMKLGFTLFEGVDVLPPSQCMAKSILDDDIVEFLRQKTGLVPFDIIIANSVLHAVYTDNYEKVFHKLAALLRNNGILLGYVATIEKSGENQEAELVSSGDQCRLYHTKDSLKRYLSLGGFHDIDTFSVPFGNFFEVDQNVKKESDRVVWSKIDHFTFFIAYRT